MVRTKVRSRSRNSERSGAIGSQTGGPRCAVTSVQLPVSPPQTDFLGGGPFLPIVSKECHSADSARKTRAEKPRRLTI
jgi:hypothetical protein